MDAFGEIYRLLSVRVFHYARMILGSREAAADVAHDVFMQILRHARRLAKAPNPVGYVMITARNLAFDALKRGKRASLPLDTVAEISDTTPIDAGLLVEDAFSRLPDSQREAVYLQHVCGYTQKEVAKIMGVSLSTVKWRCGKALAQLQNYFENQEA